MLHRLKLFVDESYSGSQGPTGPLPLQQDKVEIAIRLALKRNMF
jgi:hypothetical protein